MKIEVSKLRANPFRNLTRLPLDQDKVDALVHSIKDTSFWDNLIGRETGGGIEIAYGHHRVAALKKCGIKTIDINVRPLTDTEMVKIMSHENMGEWSHDAEFETETVRATLEAAAAGKIELPKCGAQKSRKLISARAEISYTADSLAKFLGWKLHNVETALGIIEATADGIVEEADLRGLRTRQAQVVVQQAKRIAKETNSKEKGKAVAKTLSGGMKKGGGRGGKKSDRADVTIHTAKRIADETVGKLKPRTESVPDINKFAFEMSGVVYDMLGGKVGSKLASIIQHKQHLEPERRRELKKALESLAKSATKLAGEL